LKSERILNFKNKWHKKTLVEKLYFAKIKGKKSQNELQKKMEVSNRNFRSFRLLNFKVYLTTIFTQECQKDLPKETHLIENPLKRIIYNL
jgi:hypothetical protein